MRAKGFGGVTAGIIGAAIAVVALESNTPARSANQPPAPAVPDGYVLVDQDALRRLVHDEVASQLRDFFNQVRFEQRNGQAAARLHAAAHAAGTLSSQILLYRLQHNDKCPSVDQLADGFAFLATRTDARGNPSKDPNACGPYLEHTAINPATGKSKVVSAANATPDAGWVYDPATGAVKAILPKSLKAEVKDAADAQRIVFVDAN